MIKLFHNFQKIATLALLKDVDRAKRVGPGFHRDKRGR